MVLVWAYIAFGLGMSLAILSENYPWDWNRGLIVILACVNAGLTGQIALLYTNDAWPKVPKAMRQAGNSPTAAWLLALAMLLMAAGFVAGSAARAGQPPASPLALPLIGGAFILLTGWSIARLQAVRHLGELDE